MRKKQKQHPNAHYNQIEVSFVKQNKQLSAQENRLNVQILRVHTIQKQRMVQQIFSLQQEQLCQFFSSYNVFPYHNTINLKQLLECSNLKLIKNQDKIYFGQVDKKKRVGKGVNITVDGKVFEGDFSNNQKCGMGVQIYPNGNLFLGEFQNSKKHGDGQFFWFSLSSKNPKEDQYVQYYDGQWWGGLPDGQGVHQKINGDLYTGNFKNGLKHGEGNQYFSNGDVYKGQYVNGLPQGYGQYLWGDKSYYKGDFKQGLRNGYGVWGLADQKYKGHYSMDKKVGYGVYQWESGWSYKGNFDNDLRNGFGELYNATKLVYRGFWRNGQQTDEQIKNQNNFEHGISKQFSKTSSQIYNRKIGSTQNFKNYQNYGIQFNPQEKFQNRRINKSATKRKGDDEHFGDFGPIAYKDEFILKKRPQSFNSGRKNQTRRSTTMQKQNPRSTIKSDNMSKMRQNRTNFTNREERRTISINQYHQGHGSMIGSNISRPLMKNSNFGTLYVPHTEPKRSGYRYE